LSRKSARVCRKLLFRTDGFPDSVIQQLPQLRNCAYLKMKDLVVVVDATTRKIVDVFSETQPLT